MSKSERVNALPEKWRAEADEDGLLAEAEKAWCTRSWGFQRWRIWFGFIRGSTDAPLDPFAMGFAGGLLQAADELTAALTGPAPEQPVLDL